MRALTSLRLVLPGLLLGLAALPVCGQEPAPAGIAAAPLLQEGETVQMVLAWRFRAGDDPAWAQPGLDDASWRTVEPAAPGPPGQEGDERRVVWFRRHLRLGRGLLGATLAVDVVSPGRVTVYVDGVSLGPFAPTAPAPDGAATGPRRGPAFFTLSSGADHVLAVRYDGTARISGPAGPGPRFFLLTLAGPQAALESAATRAKLAEAIAVAATTVPALLAFLHLALYWFYRKARENLFYACCMLGFAIIIFGGPAARRLLSPDTAVELARYTPFGLFSAIFFGLLTFYAVRRTSLPRAWVPFALVALLFALASSAFPGPFWTWGWYLYFAATMLEIVRVERSSGAVEREGARLLFWGLILLALFATLQVLIDVSGAPPPLGYHDVYVLGMLAFAVSMSLFLARTVARTSLHLERRLAEVEALSGQVLEQERAAHRRDLEQRLLVAENERKSLELEEARTLQLSLLPARVPVVEGLEIAVVMTTATEVGGDYYDFRPGADGALVLAVGDATGHGAAAGTMVAAVKALFSSVGVTGGLPTAMREYDRVLRSLDFERMHMCLTLARITPRGVAMSSGGMPPVKILRARSGEVEEVGRGGLPLGGNLSPSYPEQGADLATGDTLLFATDGLAELADPDGRPFGDERITEVLRSAGDRPAAEIVGRLTEAAAAWRGERQQVDDITVLVARVTG